MIAPETRIVAATKARDAHSLTLVLLKKILGTTTASLTWKETCLIRCIFTAPRLVDVPPTCNWRLDGTSRTAHDRANIFAHNGLNIGVYLFLRRLSSDLEGEIADLDCGNGATGLQVLTQNPDASVVSTDKSHMAAASNRLNVERNLPDNVARCEFTVNNSLSGTEPNRFTTVLCNPPFHQQHAITDHII